jgi:hypothetical protein
MKLLVSEQYSYTRMSTPTDSHTVEAVFRTCFIHIRILKMTENMVCGFVTCVIQTRISTDGELNNVKTVNIAL